VTNGLTEFRKSRIYAEGWNAARKSSKPSANPYVRDPERSRWLEGYTQALA
jgi:hypothetical protein